MKFRYFDPTGRQLTPEQLRSMQVMTPAMDHVFATALNRLEKSGISGGRIEKPAAK